MPTPAENLDIKRHHVPLVGLTAHGPFLAAETAAGVLHRGERFRQEIVEGLAIGKPLPEFLGLCAQLLISAGALDGRRVTCAPGIRDDVRAAGAVYSDEAVITDGVLLTGRGPDDLPAFAQAMMALLGVAASRKSQIPNPKLQTRQ